MTELELLERLCTIRDETTDSKTELSINALIADRWGKRSKESLELQEQRSRRRKD